MKKFQIFDFFHAFLHPKRPNPKIPKNRKKCIFLKKSIFFKWPSGHHRWSKMVPNRPPKCSKHIFNPYLVFISILEHSLKNRKKSIFEKFFRTIHQQNRPNFIFPAENRPNFIWDRKNIPIPLSEKISQFCMGFSDFYRKKYLHRRIWPKFNILHLGRFGYKKASKIQKFLFFQNLQNLSFLSIYTFIGIFLVGKKLCPFEIQSNTF